MEIQILISTMNQDNYDLIKRMNIFSDTIVINQCDHTKYTRFEWNGHVVDWYDCEERGVGVSRNRALMAATAEICLFADDDMVYDDFTQQKILKAFDRHKDAGLIAFNIQFEGREGLHIQRNHKLTTCNAYKYGAVNCAIRRRIILENRIFFSLLFGGGAEYSCGEDSLFISDCLSKKIHMYADREIIGKNLVGESTWFKGYTRKYFFDKGVFYKAMNKKLAKLFCIRFAILHADLYKKEIPIRQALKWMIEGTNIS